jgi:hypothetical protein
MIHIKRLLAGGVWLSFLVLFAWLINMIPHLVDILLILFMLSISGMVFITPIYYLGKEMFPDEKEPKEKGYSFYKKEEKKDA